MTLTSPADSGRTRLRAVLVVAAVAAVVAAMGATTGAVIGAAVSASGHVLPVHGHDPFGMPGGVPDPMSRPMLGLPPLPDAPTP